MLSVSNFSPAQQETFWRGLRGDRAVDEYKSKGGEFVRKGSINRIGKTLESISTARPDELETRQNANIPHTDDSRNRAISISQTAVN